MKDIVVSKSGPPVLVTPSSEPTPAAATIRLTSADKSRLGLSFTAFLVFERRRRRRRVHRPAETHVDFAYCDIMIPWSFVNRVKAEFVSRNGGGGGRRRFSVFDVVTAAIWECRTRAIHGRRCRSDAPAVLLFAVNARPHIGAKDGYYGNCITRLVVASTADAVANGDIVDVVKLVNDAKERIPEELLRNKMRRQQGVGGGGGGGGEGLFVGPMHRLYLSGTRPRRYRLRRREASEGDPRHGGDGEPSCFPCLPCSRSNGVSMVAWCVMDEHVDVFRAELARLQ
uniref:Uncharacterized protein n=1 Tax=Oryza barthii TaxID=65489 RepID=A0A0D3GKE7_9ORYZ